MELYAELKSPWTVIKTKIGLGLLKKENYPMMILRNPLWNFQVHLIFYETPCCWCVSYGLSLQASQI